MNCSRKTFLSFASAGVAFAPKLLAADLSGEVGGVYPGWRPGELDLHFIHTGRGENCFYIFPDGTTVVNDVGDYYRPKERAEIPWMPRGMDDLLGGEVVARYIGRLVKTRRLDYALVSHWHSDHTGEPARGTKTAQDGRQVCGLALLGETFDFDHFYDHQYPHVGQYGGGDVEGRDMIRAWVAAKKIPQEPFRPGALDQIKLLHDPEGKYRGKFSIRNICANAVCWTGKGEETFDYGAANTKATGKEEIANQNTLSMGFVVQYGRFRFFTGGDVSYFLKDADGRQYNYEAVVGRAVGPVTVCKTNHHAYRDAMTKEFVEQVRAQAYVTCVWCPRHIQDCNMRWMSSRALYPGARTAFVTQITDWARREWPNADWWKDVVPGGHVVVKVAPGGATYRVYVLDPVDEAMRIVSVHRFTS